MNLKARVAKLEGASRVTSRTVYLWVPPGETAEAAEARWRAEYPNKAEVRFTFITWMPPSVRRAD